MFFSKEINRLIKECQTITIEKNWFSKLNEKVNFSEKEEQKSTRYIFVEKFVLALLSSADVFRLQNSVSYFF